MKKILAATLVLGLCAMVAQAGVITLSCSKIDSNTYGGVTYDAYSVTATCDDENITAIGGGFYASATVTQMVTIRPSLYTRVWNEDLEDYVYTAGYQKSHTLSLYTYDAGTDQYYKDGAGTQANITGGDVRDMDSHWNMTTAQFVPLITAPDETYTGGFITTVAEGGYTGRLYRDTSLTVISALDLALQAHSLVIAQIVVVSGEKATFTGTLGTATGKLTAYGLIDPEEFDYGFPSFLVPEPATMTLLGLGALALIRRRRT